MLGVLMVVGSRGHQAGPVCIGKQCGTCGRVVRGEGVGVGAEERVPFYFYSSERQPLFHLFRGRCRSPQRLRRLLVRGEQHGLPVMATFQLQRCYGCRFQHVQANVAGPRAGQCLQPLHKHKASSRAQQQDALCMVS